MASMIKGGIAQAGAAGEVGTAVKAAAIEGAQGIVESSQGQAHGLVGKLSEFAEDPVGVAGQNVKDSMMERLGIDQQPAQPEGLDEELEEAGTSSSPYSPGLPATAPGSSIMGNARHKGTHRTKISIGTLLGMGLG